MIASRSAFFTPGLDLPGQGQGEMSHASQDRRGCSCSGSVGGGSGSGSLSLTAHQLLVASAFGQPLEVSADRGAHLVEVALLAHGR